MASRMHHGALLQQRAQRNGAIQLQHSKSRSRRRGQKSAQICQPAPFMGPLICDCARSLLLPSPRPGAKCCGHPPASVWSKRKSCKMLVGASICAARNGLVHTGYVLPHFGVSASLRNDQRRVMGQRKEAPHSQNCYQPVVFCFPLGRHFHDRCPYSQFDRIGRMRSWCSL